MFPKINLGTLLPGCGRFPITDKPARGRGEINETRELYSPEERSKIINLQMVFFPFQSTLSPGRPQGLKGLGSPRERTRALQGWGRREPGPPADPAGKRDVPLEASGSGRARTWMAHRALPGTSLVPFPNVLSVVLYTAAFRKESRGKNKDLQGPRPFRSL